jgi:DNA repair exonuclease SbcCD ATPase subunit
MSDIKLGITIDTDGSGAVSGLKAVDGALQKTRQASKQASAEFSAMSAGLAKINDQLARQTAAKAWTTQLGQASNAAQQARKSLESTTRAWAQLSQQGMQRLDATAWANRLSQATQQATKAINAQTSALQNQAKSQKGMLDFWGKLGVAYLAVQQAIGSVKMLVRAADTYTNLNSRLKLVSGTTTELANAQAATFSISQRYNLAWDETARLYGRIAPLARDMGQSQESVFNVITGLGAALKVAGASTADVSSSLLQLGQALSSATPEWEELGRL